MSGFVYSRDIRCHQFVTGSVSDKNPTNAKPQFGVTLQRSTPISGETYTTLQDTPNVACVLQRARSSRLLYTDHELDRWTNRHGCHRIHRASMQCIVHINSIYINVHTASKCEILFSCKSAEMTNWRLYESILPASFCHNNNTPNSILGYHIKIL